MKILLDTNILLRISEPGHPHHLRAVSALVTLAKLGWTFCIGSQTISEFLAVATRSIADRGLGMDQAKADSELTKVTEALETIYDTKAVVAELRRLVVRYSVSGKAVHDTRLVAAMNVNGISHILTINARDFARFEGLHVSDPLAMAVIG